VHQTVSRAGKHEGKRRREFEAIQEYHGKISRDSCGNSFYSIKENS